jgi:cyclohexadienyl dehydratase
MYTARWVFLAALTASGLVGCVTPTSAESHLQTIQHSGTLRVGTAGDFNPMSMRDPATNSFKGYDIDAMTQMATDLGVKVEWIQTDWAVIVPAITADKIDIFSGASLSIARAKQVAFSQPYFFAGTVPVVAKENAAKFKTWDDINQPGITVATSFGTVFDEQARENLPRATLKTVQSPASGYQEVLAGRAMVTITSNVEAAGLVKRYPQLSLLGPQVEPRNKRPFAYPVDPNDATWLTFVNNWITLKQAEGFFNTLETKWMQH